MISKHELKIIDGLEGKLQLPGILGSDLNLVELRHAYSLALLTLTAGIRIYQFQNP